MVGTEKSTELWWLVLFIGAVGSAGLLSTYEVGYPVQVL